MKRVKDTTAGHWLQYKPRPNRTTAKQRGIIRNRRRALQKRLALL